MEFTTIILKFDKKGEKTGWTYIDIPTDITQMLKPGHKKSFRVKGMLDKHHFQRVAVLPMGDGGFIMPLNAAMRKAIGKQGGDVLRVRLQVDNTPLSLDMDFVHCLVDDLEALRFFKTLTKSRQFYFSKWITEAKTEATKAQRIADSIIALSRQQDFTQMMRSLKKNS